MIPPWLCHSPYGRRGNLFLIYATGLLLGWAAMILLSGGSLEITPFALYRRYVPNHILRALVLLGIVIPVWTLAEHPKFWVRGVSLIPVHLALLFAATSSGIAVWNGFYADEEVRARLFILSDQWPLIWVAAVFTLGLIRRYSSPPVHPEHNNTEDDFDGGSG